MKSLDTLPYMIENAKQYLITQNPCLNETLQRCLFCCSDQVPLMAIGWHNQAPIIIINLDTITGLPFPELCGVLEHEVLHLVMGHLHSRKSKSNHQVWNIACDLAINQLVAGKLPEGALMDFTFLGDEAQKYLGPFLQGASAEMLYQLIMAWMLENDINEDQLQDIENHETWSLVEEDDKIEEDDDVEENDIIKEDGGSGKGQTEAEELQELEHIFDMAKKIQQLKKLDVQKIPDRIPLPTAVVSWYTVLSDITQDLVSHHKLHSLMYINRRYPYIYAGTRRKKIGHIVVYVDQSGSVSNTTLTNIRNALIELSYSFDFVTYPFTHTVHDSHKETIKNGSIPDMKKRLSGGTCFSSIVEHVEELETRPSTYIICTDGAAPLPPKTSIPRYWIMFDVGSHSSHVNAFLENGERCFVVS